MAITRLTKHEHCEVEAVKANSKHYARLICKKHNTHIQWLSKADYKAIKGTERG